MEFASDEKIRPIHQRPDGSYTGGMTRAFDRWEDAHEYAHSEYAEYGVDDQTGVDLVADLRAEVAKWKRSALRLEERLYHRPDSSEQTTTVRLTNKELGILRLALGQLIAQAPATAPDRDDAIALGWELVGAQDNQHPKGIWPEDLE